MTRTPPKLALPLILEEDWPHWKSVDRDIPNYERWVELFDQNLKVAEARGWPYERIPVRPDAFNEWCTTNKRAADKYNRSLYALKMLQEGKTGQVAPSEPVHLAVEPVIEASFETEPDRESVEPVEPTPAARPENEISAPVA